MNWWMFAAMMLYTIPLLDLLMALEDDMDWIREKVRQYPHGRHFLVPVIVCIVVFWPVFMIVGWADRDR